MIARLYHNGPGFRYHVYYRQQGKTYWSDGLITDPTVNYYEVEVNDVYQTYQISVKSENDLGESHQTAFIYKGHSGEDGKNLCLDSGQDVTLLDKLQAEYIHDVYIWPLFL